MRESQCSRLRKTTLAFIPHEINQIRALQDSAPVRVLRNDLTEEIAVPGDRQPLPAQVERIRVAARLLAYWNRRADLRRNHGQPAGRARERAAAGGRRPATAAPRTGQDTTCPVSC